MLLKPKHLWKGFLYRKARGWQHQLQTGMKRRENTHDCFSTGSICLVFEHTGLLLVSKGGNLLDTVLLKWVIITQTSFIFKN